MDFDDIDDLDFDSDPIKDFLQRKFHEIRHANEKLEKEIVEKNELLDECLRACSNIAGKHLEIVESWKRIHNDTCVFGVRLRNRMPKETIVLKNTLLNWNSANPILYKMKVFQLLPKNHQGVSSELDYSESRDMATESIIILSVEKPNFTEQIRYDIDGVVVYSTKSENLDRQFTIPTIDVEAKDFHEPSLEIKLADLLDGETKSIFTSLSANKEFDLVGKITSGCGSIEDILSTDCKYKEVRFDSSNKLFIVHELNDRLNGSMVEILEKKEDGVFTLKILCLDEEAMFQILHHMYGSIQDLCILPKTHEVHLHRINRSQDLNDETNRDKFAEALSKQIHFIQQFFKGKTRECSRENYVNFRSKLNKLQLETDLLYAKYYNSF